MLSSKAQLALLLVFFVLLRFYPIYPGNFPFAYDNAKDSLAMMQFWTFKKPPLLGAVTSMEGLYQGPLWYYILFPLNLVLGFDPLASVLTVMLLGLFTAYLFWHYLGKLEAFLYTVSWASISTNQTAWSPYLTMFSTAWILILLLLLKKRPQTLLFGLLSLSLTLMFHAETAFGLVFTILLLVVFWLNKIQVNKKQFTIMVAIFLASFMPQVIFELRHNFLEVRSIIYFIAHYQQEATKVQTNQHGLNRVGEVIGYLSATGLQSMLPFYQRFQLLLEALVIGLFLTLLAFKKGLDETIIKICLPFILGFFVLYLILPVKGYYLFGLAPIWIYALARLIKNFPKLIKPAVVIFLIAAFIGMFISRQEYQLLAQNSHILFAQRKQAVDQAYLLSEGQPFASYQYVPEVYDYTYQHIFQYTALQNHRQLPTEYSYAPGEAAYMQTEKLPGSTLKPKFTILIVESDDKPQFFPLWWDKIIQGRAVVEKVTINKAITVYKLINKT